MNLINFSIILFTIIGIIFYNSTYIQNQKEISLVTEFGKVVSVDSSPGLKVKLPFLQKVKFFDKRLQGIRLNMSGNSEVVALDQKTMQLDAYSIYKISNPKLFYETVPSAKVFKIRMNSITESSIREVIGRVIFKEILWSKRNKIRNEIIKFANDEMEKFGIEVIDIRIIRVNLPDKARNAVYSRMRSEREKEANLIRAKGDEEARVIRARADKEKMIILSEANKISDILKGEGEAKSIDIYAESYAIDKNFYEYFKILDVYQDSFKKNLKLIISTQNNFLKYFN